MPDIAMDEIHERMSRRENFAVIEGNCDDYLDFQGNPFIFRWRIIGEPFVATEEATFIQGEISRLEALGLIKPKE